MFVGRDHCGTRVVLYLHRRPSWRSAGWPNTLNAVAKRDNSLRSSQNWLPVQYCDDRLVNRLEVRARIPPVHSNGNLASTSLLLSSHFPVLVGLTVKVRRTTAPANIII